MKRKNILRISILPLIFIIALAVSNIQPPQGKDKNDKEHGQSSDKGQNANKGKPEKNNNAQAQNNKGQGNGNNKSQGKNNINKGQGNDKFDNPGNGNAGMNNSNRSANGKFKRGNGNSESVNGRRDVDINWGLEDFRNRKRPGSQKKVTVCHKAGGQNSEYPVTINVSENALQAHLNHGDERGTCSVNYSDRWSSDYIENREVVYNNYEQAWETMSYSEALLQYAAQRLLGVRTDFDRNRTSYNNQEIQRREALIFELQNNVNELENQLGYTQEKLDNDVNIIIQL